MDLHSYGARLIRLEDEALGRDPDTSGIARQRVDGCGHDEREKETCLERLHWWAKLQGEWRKACSCFLPALHPMCRRDLARIPRQHGRRVTSAPVTSDQQIGRATGMVVVMS